MTEQNEDSQTILALYADGPAQLESVLATLSESDLDLALSPDSWTIRQIVHHIADGDDIWKTCIKAALGNSQGTFTLQWYWDKPQMEWSSDWSYASRSIEPSIALLHANRRHILALFEQTPGAWEKSIRLQQRGHEDEPITVGEVLEMQARHLLGHIADIQAIQEAHGILASADST